MWVYSISNLTKDYRTINVLFKYAQLNSDFKEVKIFKTKRGRYGLKFKFYKK